MKCILCGGPSRNFYTEPKANWAYFRCGLCDLRFLDPQKRLNAEAEGGRYRTHENNAEDPRYQEFLKPLTDLIQAGEGRDILDFGCGAGPVIKYVLEPRGYNVALYDPFFYPDTEPLNKDYDFVAASEVVEHLYDPAMEFARLRKLLRSRGRLGVMTAICSEQTDFGSWHYRRDPTHVAFYSRETLEWIREKYEFKTLRILSDRLIELTR